MATYKEKMEERVDRTELELADAEMVLRLMEQSDDMSLASEVEKLAGKVAELKQEFASHKDQLLIAKHMESWKTSDTKTLKHLSTHVNIDWRLQLAAASLLDQRRELASMRRHG